ncbi:MAG: signal peptidase II [Oscillospiraceae bacterium]|nr:signal peptidase II [Oscillospiraceae bacterium]
MNKLWFLIFPIIIISFRIQNIYSYEDGLSNLLFLIVNFLFSVVIYNVFLIPKINSKTDKRVGMFVISFLVIFDQLIKIIIYNFDINNIYLIGDLLSVTQRKNIHQIGILNHFNINLQNNVIVLVKVVTLIIALILWRLSAKKFIKDRGNFNKCFILLISSALCTILDSVIWGYTLDYILFKHVFCYDLKDFYVNTAIGYLFMSGYAECINSERKCA